MVIQLHTVELAASLDVPVPPLQSLLLLPPGSMADAVPDSPAPPAPDQPLEPVAVSTGIVAAQLRTVELDASLDALVLLLLSLLLLLLLLAVLLGPMAGVEPHLPVLLALGRLLEPVAVNTDIVVLLLVIVCPLMGVSLDVLERRSPLPLLLLLPLLLVPLGPMADVGPHSPVLVVLGQLLELAAVSTDIAVQLMVIVCPRMGASLDVPELRSLLL